MDLNPTLLTANVANSSPPGVRSATPSNGDRLAHRHGQFSRSPSGLTPESGYGQGFSLSLFVRGLPVRVLRYTDTGRFTLSRTDSPRTRRDRVKSLFAADFWR